MFKQIKEKFGRAKKLAKKQPKSLHYEELEQRVLFSADIMPGLDSLAVEEQVLVEDIANDVKVEREIAPVAIEQTAAEQRWELVLVNENVGDYEHLIADLQGSDKNRIIEVVVLESDRDGIEQVNEILAERSDLAAVHFITHGADGQINLGNSWLDSTTLQQNSDAVAGWGKALTERGDILFYGCNLAETEVGQNLTDTLAELTGTDVAASDDMTGHADLGADWELEYESGQIESSTLLSEQTTYAWDNVLVTLNVTTTNDVVDGDTSSIAGLSLDKGADGFISLREAIIAANNTAGADEINLPAGTYTLTLVGSGDNLSVTGDLDINGDLTITGASIGSTIIDGGGDGAGGGTTDRVFDVLSGIVSMSNLTIQGGDISGTGGGMLIDANGTVTLNNVTIDSNAATTSGGGINNEGTVTLTGVTISNNTAGVSGGGIFNADKSSLIATNVTISGNYAVNAGGGLYNGEDAILKNVTITNNTAGTNAGGIIDWGQTVTDIMNSIVAGNHVVAASGSVDLDGDFTSSGNNLIGDIGTGATGFTDGVSGDQVGPDGSPIDPLLGSLADNGGPTMTHALLTGSTAINAGTSAGAPATDQRGITRDDGFIDIGAYEITSNVAPVITSDGGGANAGINVVENTTAVTTVTATDADAGDTLTYSIDLASDDAAKFSINGTTGELAFASAPDFESPTDVNGDNTYEVTVQVDDGNGGTDTQDISVTVTPVNDAPSFAIGDGSAITPVGSSHDYGYSVTVQPDGKSLVGGYSWTGSSYDFVVTRYNTDGTLDASFGGGDGIATVDVGSGDDLGFYVTLQPDGKILLAGAADNGVDKDFALTRLNSDGTLDTTFGGDGIATTDIAVDDDYGKAIALQADGKIVVAGFTRNGTNNNFALIRYNSDGTLDTSFDGDGIVTTAVPSFSSHIDDIALQADGKIVVIGDSQTGGGSDFAIVRYNTDGSLDTGFGGSGIVTTSIGTTADPQSIAVQADGKILAGGFANNGTDSDFAVARYNDNGTLDTSFGGGDGIATIAIGSGDDRAYNMAVLPDGKIILSGSSDNGTDTDFSVARLNSDGSLDTSFGGGDGFNIMPVGGANDTGYGMAIAPDGSILLAGSIYNGSNVDFALQHFTDDGVLDTSFDPVNTLDGNPTFVEDGAAVVLDADVDVSDAELGALNSGLGNYAGASLTLVRNGGVSADDAFAFNDASGITLVGGNLIKNSQIIASFDTTTTPGELVVSFSDAGGEIPTSADVDNILRQITYSNSSEAPPATVQIDWTFDDGNSGAQGSGGALTATGSTTVSITAVNDAPVITSDGSGDTASINLVENSTVVTTVTSTDVDGGTAAYSISGGVDAALFNINSSTGELTFIAAPDYEAPVDDDGNNVYEVTVQVSDGNGGFDTQDISVTVTDVSSNLIVTTTADVNDGDISSAEALNASKGPDGYISLHEAILAANNSSENVVISFNISDPLVNGAHTFVVGPGGLPTISDTVTIDGRTDSDYAGNPVIRLDGSSAGAGVNGLSLAATSDGSVVRGLMITGFSGYGIQVDVDADGITIANNWIGTTGTGSTGVGNSNSGINIQGANTIIGGIGANDGNVITNNGNEGINVTGSGATGTIIQGNIIGLDPDGSTGSGNADVGIALLSGADNTTIGGTTVAARNVISSNFEGIEINSNNNIVQGNYIGTDITGTLDRGNHSDDGVEIKNGATGNLIGGMVAGAGNLIAFNARDGVYVASGTNNTILGNQIHSNSGLGIDLGTNGVTANDAEDVDTGTNDLLNFPILTNVVQNGADLDVDFAVDLPAGNYRIEFFDNPNGLDGDGFGEGETHIGFANISVTGAAGYENFSTTLTGVTASDVLNITATATEADGTFTSFGSTSEFGPPLDITAPTQINNTGSTVTEGGTDTITNGELRYDDDIQLSTSVTYSVTASPVNGRLEFVSAPGGPITSFTQNDLDNNRVVYVHNGSETLLDSFNFDVDDGQGNSVTGQYFAITVTPVNDAAPVANDDAYAVDEDNTLTIDWWDTDWNRRQQLTFDNLAQAETLTDFPVLVILNSSNIDYAQTKDDGSDLRFFAAAGTPLAYEIEQWNEGGDSSVWVRVPQITGNSNSDSIWMYYGNDTAEPVQDVTGVWDMNFVGVWHLNEEQAGTGSAGVYQDATSHGNIGIDRVAATGQDGQVAAGQEFGANDWIEIEHDPSLDLKDSMTISFWIKPASDSGTFNRVVEKGLWGYNNSYYFGGGNGTNDLTFYLNGQEVIDTPDDVLTVGEWQHAAVSYTSNGDGTGTAQLYLNGVEIASGNYTNGVVAGNTERLAIGHSDPLYDFDGFIDEVQISDTDRSADWIAAQYRATKNQFGAEFVQFGGEESAPAVGGVLSNDTDVDGDPLTVTLVDGPDNAQSFTLNKDGTFTYTPTTNYHGSDTFTYEVSDGNGGTAQATATITINPVNDDPAAIGESFTAVEGIPFTAELGLNDLLLNDTDIEGDTLSVNTTPVTGPANGSLVLNADGTFTYTPNNNFNGTDSFVYEVLDGNGGSAQATATFTVQPREIRILFTTQSDVNNSKVPGISSWDAGDVLGIGDPNLSFEPAGSDGSVLPYMDLEAFAASSNMTVNGLHFVSNDITVGGANSVDLKRGDLLFVSDANDVMTSTNSLGITGGDVIVFRPDAIDDYSSGTFIHLLDQPDTEKTTGITLIEKDVLIGDVTLQAGTFLFTQESVVEEGSIYHFSADDAGAGTTTGTVSTLISSVDIDVNWNNFVGVMVISEDLYLDGTMVPAGSIVTTLSGGDSFVGNNGIEVNEDEIFYLTVTSTTMGSGTTVADATVLFDGGDIGLNNNSKKMRSLAIIEEITPVNNVDPVITLSAGGLNYTEQDPATIIDSAATLTDPDSTDFDGGLLRVDLDTTGTANDRLAIHHEGNAAGQIGISGNTVNYGGLAIGTFAGGTDGSDPLTVLFNANADVTAVEAVMRNITFENVSSNPSTAQRSVKFSVTDGDGGASSIVSKTIVINDVNVAPVITDANNLTAIDEDAFNNGGMLVSDLISGWITDADPGALLGIAVVGTDNTNGSWEFSTNGGSTWTAFGSPGTDAARLLAANPDTFVRFVPDPNWNGTVTNGITFHAWDQTDGINGDEVDLLASGNVRDQFDTVNYSNTDGSAAWTSDWVEYADNDSAASGNVRVEAGKLHLDNLDGGTSESITRSADLSGAVTATLIFDYDAFGGGGLDTVAFEISNDGGNNWTLLESVDCIGNIAGSKSYDLESFTTLTADMQIRFRVLEGFDGSGEHINFDNVDISYNGTGIGGSSSVSTATASSSITVNAINDAPMMTAWFDAAWTGRKALTIDASQVAGDVSDFPVLITLNVDAELAAQALANGDDIVFTAGDGATQLAHEIEYFDETTGELRAWVKADLSGTVDTGIYMYYGNSGAANQENAAGVWSSNYVGVYHLGESPTGAAGELVDSSGSGNNAVTEGSMDASDSVATAIGNGLAFDGVDDKLRIPDSANLDGLNDAATFSLWINWADAADGDHQIVMTSENRFSGGDGYEWASQGDGDHFFYPDATTPDGNYNLGPNPFTNGQWHHLAATMDFANKEVKIYVDGNEMTFNYEGVPTRWTDLSDSGDLLWGGNPDRASRYFLGMMDEIRLADVVRSQEWIRTEVNNQTNSGAFVTVGTAELPQSQHTLTDIAEDDYNSAGDSVLSIINSVGGDRITDNDDGAVEGVAVVGVDDTNGEWQYDANADGTWIVFGSVSDSAAVLLDTGALVRFVPDPDYNGTAGNLTFRAWDQTSHSNGDTAVDVSTNGDDSAFSSQTATATLNVIPVNDEPVANADTITVAEGGTATLLDGGAANVLANDTGLGDTPVTVSLITDVTQGTLTLNADGTFSYTHNGTENFSDSFTYRVTDNDGQTSDATVTITITPVSDETPIANADTITVAEGGIATLLDGGAGSVLANDSGLADTPVTVSLVTDVTQGSLTLNADGTFSYTHNGSENFSDSFTYRVTDNDGQTSDATVSITITPVSDETPIANADTITVAEGGIATLLDGGGSSVLANDSGLADTPVTVSLVTDVTQGSLILNADGTFSYTHNGTENFSDSFTYRVTDNDGQTSDATVTITITPVSDATPVANADTITVVEGGTATLLDGGAASVLANDAGLADTPVIVSLVTDVTQGTLTLNADGTFSYTHNSSENFSDSFTYRVTDNDGQTSDATVTINITPVSEATPVASADTITVAEGGTVTLLDGGAASVLTNDSGLADTPVTVSLVTDVTQGSLTLNADGTFSYTHNGSENFSDSFTYRVTDNDGQTSDATVTITITPVSDTTPVANADTITIAEGGTATLLDGGAGNVLANDAGLGDTPVTVSLVTDVTQGSLTLNADGTFSYTHNGSENFSDSFTYRVTDNDGQTSDATVTITITPVSDNTPIANADAITVAEGGTATLLDGGAGNVLANDTGLGDTPVIVSLVTDATQGVLTLNADGTFSYTHNGTENFSDSFTYRVTDNDGQTSDATVTITITPVSDNTPVANADTITVAEGGTATLLDGGAGNVLANDTGLADTPVTVSLVTDVTQGTLTLNADGTFSYTHNGSENFSDSFTYRVTDNDGQTSDATVTITITPVSDATPVANADAITVAEGGTATLLDGGASNVLANDTGLADTPVTVSLVTDVTQGALTLNADGTFSYTHNGTENFSDSFTYRVTDNDGQASDATVTITITPVSDATPVANADTITVAEGGTATLLDGGASNVLANDAGLADTPVTVSLVTDVTQGTLTLNADGTFSYTHNGSENFSDSFTYRVTDNDGQTSDATVNITITPVSDTTPVANADTITIAEGGTATLLDGGAGNVLANDAGLGDTPVTVSLVTDVTQGSLTLNADGTFSYTHNGSENFSDSFTYRVTDNDGQTSDATVNITITPVSDETPIANADTITVVEGGTATLLDGDSGNVLANDVGLADTPVTVSLVTDVTQGALTLNPDGTFSYTHNGTENFSDSFTYRVTDNDGQASDATVTITITPVSDATPVANADTITVAEGGTATLLDGGASNVLANDAGLADTPVTVSLVTDVTQGSLTLNADGTFSYTHNGTENFSDSFTYRVTDNDGQTSDATVSITITPVSDATPVATADTITVAEGGTATLLDGGAANVLANDAGLADTPVTVSLVTDVTQGTLTLNADGTFSYTHNGTENFTDSFTYRVTDNDGQASDATVTITITPVSDATPVANADTITVAEGGTATLLDGGAANVLANDAGLADTPVTVSLVTDVTQGSLTLNADGTFSYTHNGTENFTDSFTYRVTDNDGQTSDATVSITVTPVSDATPVANADTITVAEGGTATLLDGGAASVLANDAGLGDTPVTVSLVTDVIQGTLTLNADGTFSYTHNGSENFSDSFTYRVTDNDGQTSDATVTITITPVSDATPVANADTITVAEGGTATLLDGGASNVLANDAGLADTPVTVSLVTDVTQGTLTLNADGTFSYTHNGSENFSDSFTYRVTDNDGQTSDATVTITITPVSDATPVANADTITVAEGGTATLLDGGASNVLANDAGLGDTPVTVSLVTDVTQGTLTLNADGTFSYTHNGTENFSDSFTYRVTDNDGQTSDATVSITITPVSDTTPVANADTITVAEGGTTTLLDGGASNVLANDAGLADTPVTVSLVTDVTQGTLTLNPDGTFSYTHNGTENFSDSFTYRVTDNDGQTSDATVSITITPVSDATPVANADTITVAEGGTATLLDGGAGNVLANDTGLSDTPVTVSLVTDVNQGSLTLNADGTFSYTHNGSENFSDSFTYRVTDNDGQTSDATVSITITPVSDNTPIANADTITVVEGGTATLLDGGASNVLANDSGLGDTPVTVSLVTDVTQGTLTLNADGTFSYTHNGTENFSDSFTYRVTDNDGQTSDATVSITITPVSDATPVANADTITVAEGGTATLLDGGAGNVLANDAGLGDTPVTVSLVNDVTQGTLTLNADGTFSYTHNGTENFSDSFTYRVTDNDGQTSDATVTITITPVSDATPVANADTITVAEGGTATLLDGGASNVLANDAGLADTPVTVSLVTDVTQGTLTLNADGTFSYTHNGSENFSDSFTYRVTDNDGQTSDATVTITITPVSDATPVANADTITVAEGGTATLLDGGASNVLANDAGLGDTPVTVSLVTDVTQGTLTLNADGTFSYTHNGTENFSDSFTYRVTDNDGQTSDATVTITITPVSDAIPVANADTITVAEGGTATFLDGGANNVLANDAGLGDTPVTVSLVTDVTQGTLTLNANGTFSYTHNGTENFSDSFTYRVTDNDGQTSDATVTITITPVSDATPVANADTITVAEGGTATLLDGGAGSVLANDAGLGDTPVTVSLVTDVTQGTLTLNANGTFSYTHNGTENFSDSFTYRVTDNDGQTSDATVTITITPVSDATPVANADTITVSEGGTATLLDGGAGNVLANDTGLADTPVTVSMVTDVTQGTLTLNADGTFSYTHNGTENFSDSFTYRVTDNDGQTSDATVSITITPVSDATPLATADTITVTEGGTATLLDGGAGNVLANDTGLADTPVTVSLVTDVTQGSLTLNADGTFSYTHNGSENFSDSFTYRVTDNDGQTSDATVSITITPVSDNTPVANADAITVAEGGTATLLDGGGSNVLTNDTGLADTPVTVSLVTDATQGTLTLNADGTFSYTHNGSENFSDSFTYRVTDNDGQTSDATVTINITPVSDATPVANADTITVAEGGTATLLDGGAANVLANDAGLADTPVTVSLVTDVTQGTLTLNADGTFSYTHNGTENFTDSFTYRVTDNDGQTSDATVTITITPVSDATPVANADTITVTEGGTATLLDGGGSNVLANDTGLADSPVTVSLVTDVTQGTLTLNADGTFSYTHNGTENFSDSFTYRVTDNDGQTSDATVTITINPINDNDPVSTDDSITVDEDATITTLDGGATSVLANDTDADLPNDTLTVSLGTGPAHGSLTLNADGTFSYTHDGSENFSDSFTYIVSDTDGGVTDTGTVSITINPINDSDPVAVDETITVNEGATITTLDGGATSVLANDADTDLPNDTLTVALGTGPAHGSLTLNADGTLSYTHDGSENFSDSFTYIVSDADGGVTDTGTVSITINPVNDVPSATADSFTVNEGSITNLNLVANDSDADDGLDLTSLTIVSGPTNGSLVVNGDGTVDYTHDGSETVADSFTYTIDDLAGTTSNTVTVSLTIAPVNDAPTVTSSAITTATEDAAYSYTITTSDVDGDALTITAPTLPAWMTLVDNGDGTATLSGTPTNSEVGDHSVVLAVSDSSGSDTQNFTLNVSGATIDPDAVFELTETDDGQDPAVEVPTYEDPAADPAPDPVIESAQSPPVEEYSTIQDSVDADDQLVNMQDPAVEDAEEIILLTDEIDTDSQSEGRDDDRSDIYFDYDFYKDRHLSKYLDFNYRAADNEALARSGDDFSLLDFNSDDPILVDVNGDYDLLRKEIDESFDTELDSQSVRAKIVTVTTASFTVGIVSYLLRAGSLVASLMSSLPLWRGFDPIAIFSGEKKKKKDRKTIPDTDELKSETLFDGEAK